MQGISPRGILIVDKIVAGVIPISHLIGMVHHITPKPKSIRDPWEGGLTPSYINAYNCAQDLFIGGLFTLQKGL